MRLEVLVQDHEAEVYPLSKAEVLIGSGTLCDVNIGSRGISRKHVKITCEGQDKFYITDLGSTNGTFINEERLAPGRKTEFTSFFPVRLGDNVLLSLLSDLEGQDIKIAQARAAANELTHVIKPHVPTKVLGLSDLKKAKTADLVKKRAIGIEKNKNLGAAKEKSSSSSEMTLPIFFCILIIGGAVYFQTVWNGEAPEDAEVLTTTQAEPVKIPPKVLPTPPPSVVSPAEVIPKERMASLFTDLKCVNPEELAFCNAAPSLKEEKSGAIQIGLSFVILVEEKKWLEAARIMFPGQAVNPAAGNPALATGEVASVSAQKIPKPGPKVPPPNPDQLYKVAFLEFLNKELRGFNAGMLKENTLYFSFYSATPGGAPQITKVLVVTDVTFPKLLSRYNEGTRRSLQKYGYQSIAYMDTFFTYY